MNSLISSGNSLPLDKSGAWEEEFEEFGSSGAGARRESGIAAKEHMEGKNEPRMDTNRHEDRRTADQPAVVRQPPDYGGQAADFRR
jgi:hypothetical protein